MSDRDSRGSANNGVVNSGSGNVSISGSAFGHQTSVTNVDRAPAEEPIRTDGPTGFDVGVITILSEETRAVVDMFKASGAYRKQSQAGGLVFHEAEIEAAGRRLKLVATQALDQGQQSSVIAYHHLQQFYSPAITVLVGIAGAIQSRLALGDVVVVQDVIYYDLRKEVPGKTIHRGRSLPVPAPIRRATNDFFSTGGEPRRAAILDRSGTLRTYSVWPGPIGSGEAVVADADSEIRRYVTDYNDKTLALEMEAKGVAQAFYEAVNGAGPAVGWLAVRGISDDASPQKNDAYHEIASWHAAMVLYELLPYLAPLTTSAPGPAGS
jgi:adenosylhomocysteine nucleosidase